MRPGLVEIVESCYRLDGDVESWMADVGKVVDAHLGIGLGMLAIRYRIAADLSFQPIAMFPINTTPDAITAVQRAMVNVPPSYIAATFGKYPADFSRSTGPAEIKKITNVAFRDHFERLGWDDILCINGLDPTHHGFYLGALMPKRGKMTAALRSRWSRISAHMAAAHRLRVQLGERELRSADTAEAILTPSGRVEHADDDAKDAVARETLAEGVKIVDRARGKLRRADPDLALSEWRALLAARWTLVDHFESDGKRYVLARRNAPVPSGLHALTTRERQALGFARLGHSNKLIAYEMGISASTVAVLLFRCAKKLGCSRDDLIDVYTRMLTGA